MVGIVLSMNTCDASSKITTSNIFFSRGRRFDTFSGERSQQGKSERRNFEYTSIVFLIGQNLDFLDI